MSPDLVRAAGVLVVAGCSFLVVARTATAPVPPPLKETSAEVRAAIAEEIRQAEVEWRKTAQAHFPADHWSARDDFHGHESERMLSLAHQGRAPLADAIRAVDEDVRRPVWRSSLRARIVKSGESDPRGALAVPCKPRPFYD